MLNIGLLAPGAGEYYIGEVATSAEDYYTGRGETAGRWVGSLAKEMHLEGAVEPDHFRAVLAGCDPLSGEQLVERSTSPRPTVFVGDPDKSFDVLQTAAFLGVSEQYVRRLLQEGDRFVAEQIESDEVAPPRAYLVGTRVSVPKQKGPDEWRVTGAELQRLVLSRSQRKYRPGFDLTLRPPKSVSVLWAVGGAEIAAHVREAHEAAVDQVVDYYEQHAIRSRSSASGRRVRSDGIVAAAFDHRTSRAGDPLLHTHVVTANMTRFADKNGEIVWRAIESPALFEHARAGGFLYQAHLRHELATRLGVRFTDAVHGYAEIEGVPTEVIDRFSKRRHEIEEELAATGRSSAKSAQVITLETRKAEDYSVDADTLMERWRAEAAEIGFDKAAAAACTGHDGPDVWTAADEQELLDMLAGPRGLCERAATFRRSDVVEHVALLVGAQTTASEVEAMVDRFLSGGHVLRVDEIRGRSRGLGQERWTTKEMSRVEQKLLDLAASTASGPAIGATTASLVDAVVLVRPELSDEQQAMVRSICLTDRFVLPVEGRPGAGKTYATDAVVAAHVAASVPILGCAVSAAAAAELESQAGFARSVMAATTVAKMLWDLDRFDGLAPGATVIVDEASMIATRDLARLAEHVHAASGRIVLVGDPDQHGAVEAGGVFAHLCATEGDGLVRLVENRRQADHTDRMAVEDYRSGLIDDAVGRLDDAGKVVRSATAAESFDAMVADWFVAHRAGSADPMIAGPNSTRRALNDRARVLLKAAGELTGEPLRVSGREFMVGDVVVARRNDRTLIGPQRGDFVKNGSAGTLTAVHHDRREVTVAFDAEGVVRLPHAYLAGGHLEHGYARTTYGVQGHTHTVARYHPTDASSFEEGYVAVTRGRDGARLYVVDGTIAVEQEEHDVRSLQRHGLDDITDAFGRRRANTMAADGTASLDEIADVIAIRSHAQIHHRRRDLERLIARAPRDATIELTDAGHARDALAVRERTYLDDRRSVPADVQARIAKLDRVIGELTQSQTDRERWFDDHSDVVHEHDVLRGAERTLDARLRSDPTAGLPAHVRAALGARPGLQRERNSWNAAASAVAIHLARHDITPDRQADGIEALLGPRPADAAGAASWTYAARHVAAHIGDAATELEAGTGAEL